MGVIKVIFIILEVLLLFNLLIFVHELGHFLAGKWRGLKIERFAIWFGRPIWKKKIGGVEYALGWIPAGGYVALPQMATMEAIEGKGESSGPPLPPISALDKIIVAAAGPLFSFLLAVAFALVVWGVGRPVNTTETNTTIGWVDPNGPAWKSGLRPGDVIREVDGQPVGHFTAMTSDSITWRIISSEGTNIPIKYVRDGREFTAYPAPYLATNKWYERKALRRILIAPASAAVLFEVATNSPAALAGLKTGDEIVAVDGEKIFSFIAVLNAEEAATNAAAGPVKFTVRRGQDTFDCELRAERAVKPADSQPSFGIIAFQPPATMQLVYPNPWEQIKASVGQIVSTVRTVSSPKSDVGVNQLGGPVMIIRVYKNFFEMENGWRMVIWFSVVMNVNLALLNMLPFPVLDGGHITLSLIEVVRRRPVSGKLLGYIQNSFAMILIGFMIYIAALDSVAWFISARADHAAEVRDQTVLFAPKK